MTTLPVAALKMLTTQTQDAFRADHEYVHEHFEEWLKTYPEHWVVVKDRQLLLATQSEDEARAAIEEHGPDVVVDFIYPRGFQRVSAVHD